MTASDWWGVPLPGSARCALHLQEEFTAKFGLLFACGGAKRSGKPLADALCNDAGDLIESVSVVKLLACEMLQDMLEIKEKVRD